MAGLKIRKGDRVVVLQGKDRGKQGDVTRVIPADGQGHRRGRQHRQEAPEADPGDHAGRDHRQGHADPRVQRRHHLARATASRPGSATGSTTTATRSASASARRSTSDERHRDRSRPRCRGSSSATTTSSGPSSRSRSGCATSWRCRGSRRSSSTWASASVQQSSLLDGAVADLTVITGPEAVVTRAKKSIAGFKLREGNAIGAKVTLRGDRMWEFLDRLISLAIPRIRDFRGLPPTASTAPATTRSASPSS